MEKSPSTSKVNSSGFDDDVFDDSSFLAKFQESTFRKNSSDCANDSINNSKFNVSALCCDEEIPGYDKLAGRTWIYPTNYSVRNYQFNIINAALVKNTLVSLPTGLGKTFIAAVIMYNFYRWYPTGKIIFTAPTRPLVAQQIDACYNIVAIPPDDTIEMTGHMQTNTRKTHWKSKRVFFATPQVIYNDIQSGICPADKIRCLVIDEAHRARGNYAYCQIVSTLTDMGHKVYRVLALSATPGSKVDDVVNVVKNLHITHLELRTENCIDVAPYRHIRKINTVVIPLGPELTHLRNQYVEILDGYARRLKQLNILPNNVGNLSKGRVVMLYKEFQTRDRGTRHPQHNVIMKDFMILIALYHGLELLIKHGTRVFLNFFDEHPEKSWIQADYLLMALLERLRDDLGINPLALDRSILPDGTMPEIPDNLLYGHPKFDKLKEIMLQHFQQAHEKKQDTRAIVFCEYRESVNLVHCLLLQCRPLIKAQMFVGQGASGKDGKTAISQKQQLRVMKNFREGASNVLVATCVAEEGLDVGSVDLIVCFDISNRSPIRLVQRCGRTGRERGGNVQILVTEGREHQTLMDCIRQSEGLNKKILQSKEVQHNLYKLNPRMMPHDFTPTCQKMYITVKKQDKLDTGKDKKSKKGQKDLRTMLLAGKTSSSSSNSSLQESCTNPHISEEEFKEIFPSGYQPTSLLPRPKEYWAMDRETFQNAMQYTDESPAKLSKCLEWQRTLQDTVYIGHTRDSGILSELLQYCVNKRFDGPTNTQNPSFATQDIRPPVIIEPIIPEPKIIKKKQKPVVAKSPNKNNGDIRALFSTATKSTKNYTKLINNLGVPNDGTITTSLIDLFVDLSIESTNTTKPCYICQNICKCELFINLKDINKKSKTNLSFLTHMILPSVYLVEAIDKESLLDYNKNKVNETQDFKDKTSVRANFDLEIEFESLEEVNNDTLTVAAEDTENNTKNIDKVVNSMNKTSANNANNFDLGDIDEIFVESSPEEAINKELNDEKNDSNPKEALEFFGLDSIDDIFADSDNSILNTPEIKIDNEKIEEPRAPSPSLLSGSVKRNNSMSPILCTQKKNSLSTKKNIVASSTPNIKTKLNFDINQINYKNKHIVNTKEITQNSKTINNISTQSNNKSLFTITQLVEMINKTGNSTGLENSSAIKNKTKDFDNDLIVDDNEIITSPILLTQAHNKETTFKMPCKINNKSKIELENTFKMSSNIENNSIIEIDNTERCSSPILLTQTGKKKNKTLEIRRNDSLVILPSDSDSDDTVIYDLDNDRSKTGDKTKSYDNFGDKNKSNDNFYDKNKLNDNLYDKNKSNDNFEDSLFIRSPLSNKRKLDDDNASPFFKKQKTEPGKSLQEKIITALSLNRKSPRKTDNFSMNFVLSQKENLTPSVSMSKDLSQKSSTSKLDLLQKFRRDKKKIAASPHKIDFGGPKKKLDFKNNLTFDDDSDDDFDFDDKKRTVKAVEVKQSIVNHKVRKKKRSKNNSLIDLEAELSGSECSGDELSDESVGSIIDFICDEPDETRPDIQAVYLESVKDQCKGTFKIPQLPTRYDKEEVFSQYVDDNDAYEMDSFCVDSHVGLTQVHDMSELELAERQLEIRKKSRRKRIIEDTTFSPTTADVIVHSDNDSPLVRRKNKRRISSDSE